MKQKPKNTELGLQDPLLRRWINVVSGILNHGTASQDSRIPLKGSREKTDATLSKLWTETQKGNTNGNRSRLEALVSKYSLDMDETTVVVALLFERLAMYAAMRTDVTIEKLFHSEGIAASLVKAYEKTGPTSKLITAGLIERRGMFATDSFLTPKALKYFGMDNRRRLNRGELAKVLKCENSGLTEAIEARIKFSDVVLTTTTKEIIDDALFYVKNRDTLLKDTGLDAHIEKGRGLALLFHGSPGTGKSMAAEAFAGELGVKVAIVRPEQLESKYFGETEKRIVALFKEAEKEGQMLVFDECDSLFATRPHGAAYQNAIVSRCVNLLLRGIEEGSQVYVLTTNRADCLDHALDRRLAYKIEFGIPDEKGRRAIWKRLLPTNHNISEEDLNVLSEKYVIAGGTIKQVVLAALRRVTREGRQIGLADLDLALAGRNIKTKGIGF
jgi:AAA+ superfamily predicted ATPase